MIFPLQQGVRRNRKRAPIDVLREVFGFDRFRGEQLAIIQHLVAGSDAIVLMPTGGGKSLRYQIPALISPGLDVVVSPLIALLKDQVDALRQLGVRAVALDSRLSPPVTGAAVGHGAPPRNAAIAANNLRR